MVELHAILFCILQSTINLLSYSHNLKDLKKKKTPSSDLKKKKCVSQKYQKEKVECFNHPQRAMLPSVEQTH